MAHKQILHLGCGLKKHPDSIGIDINPRSKADIVHDLNKFPYPFKKNVFELVFAEHIIEHLDNIPKVMKELHRICKNGAKIVINSSHFSSVDSFTDPTHKHFFTSRTFDYFIPGTYLEKFRYSDIKFRKIKVELGPVDTKNPVLRIILFLINRKVIFYEKRLAFIFPVGNIKYELEVMKN